MRSYSRFIRGRSVPGETGAPIDCRCRGNDELVARFVAGHARLDEFRDVSLICLTAGKRSPLPRHA